MVHLADLSRRVEAVFADIAATRMQGVPVMHPHLGVAMRGLRRHGAHDVGVLVTPWFMNLVLLPLTQPEKPERIGTTRSFALPSGHYEAMLGHEPALGFFWSCSLFSPMWEFADMEMALATADASLDLVFAAPHGNETQAAGDGEDFREAMVRPAPARGVDQRLVEAEEAKERVEAAVAPAPERIDRRALFGLRRSEPAQAAG